MINQYVQTMAMVDHPQHVGQPAMQRQAIPVPGPSAIRPSSIYAPRP
ncbi:MAG TPA: hypothetical protein VKC56_08940 [Gallionellaceae bacterium]|nr:hypothetical protein [Gallionellaceae bacterium]